MLYVSAANRFNIAAFEAAYREGAPWLDELLGYFAVTRDFVRTFMQQQLHRIKLIEPDGTYLLWLDCREMKLSDKQDALNNQPQHFGESGFMRMNIGAPRKVIAESLQKIARAERLLKRSGVLRLAVVRHQSDTTQDQHRSSQ
ncbi:MAG: hypothetical protein DID90_2727553139 [Candidatus Nitrotoga sp. LAW]|nr:MAG: hypothetical protein DID90_2727553139 [Candidatus Nitrotoga sp. LAW]